MRTPTLQGHTNRVTGEQSRGDRLGTAQIMEIKVSEGSGYYLVRDLRVLVFHVTGGDSHKQIDEEDGVQRQRLRGFVLKCGPPGGLS